jgi:hypothetical protein
MRIVYLIARILLGLMFVIFGANGLVPFLPMILPPGDAGRFLAILLTSHYVYLVSGVQLIAGILLLVNRFMPLAIVLLGAVIANILVYHLTLLPEGIGLALVALILWLIVTYQHRSALSPIFVQKLPSSP